MSENRRHFLQSCGRLAALAPLAGFASLPSAVSADAPTKPLRVCMLSGCYTYNSDKSLSDFKRWLEKKYHVGSRLLSRKSKSDLPGLEHLDECDVTLVFIKRMELSGEQLSKFKTHMLSGKPVVAIRTASHAVQSWLDFDRVVLGGNYQNHYDKGPITHIKVAAGAEDHPILKGVKLTTAPGPLYKNRGHANDIKILLEGSITGHTEPSAWTREFKGARIFYTELGNPETFADDNYRRMIANALFWVTRRELSAK